VELSECIRQHDVLGRFGGDEFIVCLPNTDIQVATIISERMRQCIEDMEIFHDTKIVKMTACFGVAEYDCSSEECMDAFVKRADNNLYVAKNNGNSVHYS
jgi:diguanylate cyclase (GGDEF)-like protein